MDGRVSRKLAKTSSNRKYRPREKQKPDAIVVGANKRLASRLYQLKTGHCLTGQYPQWTTRRPDTKCWWCQYSIQIREHLFKSCPQWRCQQKPLWAAVLEETKKLPGLTRGRHRTKLRSCSPMSGAAKRSSFFSQPQTSERSARLRST